MTDIQIANQATKENIIEIAKKLGIEKEIECYGNDKAKINFQNFKTNRCGKLILVTSINPTPYGEGKTTVSIGLNDGLNKIGEKSIAVLREPSLGPVFGIKGGATGGGYSQVIPMEDINLHFTGDFHAITTANNLISAAIDNHLYFGNELQIDPNRICFHRCLDMNDRALRNVQFHHRKDSFHITAASEIMSILCFSKDLIDLKKKLSQILIGFNKNGAPIYTKDLKLEGALATILKDAIKPNLVQSLENNPILIHGGPFANIAHGCNSIIATRLGLQLADYVVTEAGFGSDLGAEKFLDIKCPKGNFKPNAIVLTVTIKALKYNAYVSKDELEKENLGAVKEGIANLDAHIHNMLQYTSNVIVTLNQYHTDTWNEIHLVQEYVQSKNLPFAVITSYQDGGKGAVELAQKVIELCKRKVDYQPLYQESMSVVEKIETICEKIYHTTKVNYSKEALVQIENIEQMGYSNLPICIAKTQYSISDDPNLRGNPKNYDIHIKDVNIYTGAGFIVVYLKDIMTMPGLSRHPNYEIIDIDENYQIKGIF